MKMKTKTTIFFVLSTFLFITTLHADEPENTEPVDWKKVKSIVTYSEQEGSEGKVENKTLFGYDEQGRLNFYAAYTGDVLTVKNQNYEYSGNTRTYDTYQKGWSDNEDDFLQCEEVYLDDSFAHNKKESSQLLKDRKRILSEYEAQFDSLGRITGSTEFIYLENAKIVNSGYEYSGNTSTYTTSRYFIVGDSLISETKSKVEFVDNEKWDQIVRSSWCGNDDRDYPVAEYEYDWQGREAGCSFYDIWNGGVLRLKYVHYVYDEEKKELMLDINAYDAAGNVVQTFKQKRIY